MKRLVPHIILLWVCASISYGTFDRIISDTYEGGSVQLNNQSLLVTGAGAISIMAKGESYIEVQNTATPLEIDVAGIYTLGLDDTSTMNYYGGETGGFYIYDNATAVFRGGRINYLHSYQHSDILKHVTFICDVDSVIYNTSTHLLTGDWLNNGGSFSITLVDQSGYDSTYSNINFIPEPATLALLGLGGLLLKRKR